MTGAEPLLEVADLAVSFATEEGVVRAVDGVSLRVGAGEVLAIVGESGSGKSVLANTVVGLTRGRNTRVTGSVRLRGQELLTAGAGVLRQVRGGAVAMIFQNPMTSLHPMYRVGDQIAEQIRQHRGGSRAGGRARAVELLRRVGIPDPVVRARAFPHELSGGMRQRVMIAMAISCDPSLLIADEATTALDVTMQAQIIDELKELRSKLGMALMVITHDMGIVAEIADRVVVMYAGRIVEQGAVDDIFYDPQHPYTWGLLGSIPRIDDGDALGRLTTIPGSAPTAGDYIDGCRFGPRCPYVTSRCSSEPPLTHGATGPVEHQDRCWLGPDEKRRHRVVRGRIGLPCGSRGIGK